MEVIKTNEPCRLCGAFTNPEDSASKYLQCSKYVLISMIKNKGVPLKYGFTRSKCDLVDILVRLDNGVDHQTILEEQRNTLYNS
jgi:hypothetical protein